MMRGDKHARATLRRLIARFGDLKMSKADLKLEAALASNRKRGAEKKWDEFIDQHIYLKVEEIMSLGIRATQAKERFADYSGQPKGAIENRYLEGQKEFGRHSAAEQKRIRGEIIGRYQAGRFGKFLNYLKRTAGNR